jgi:hypothetical protein
MLFLLVMKHSRSTPGLQVRARPPLEPTGATWQMRKKPRELRIEETRGWGNLVSERKRISGLFSLMSILKV